MTKGSQEPPSAAPDRDAIGGAIRLARAWVTDRPEDAMAEDAAVTATLEGGLRAVITDDSGTRLVTDMPPEVGGRASAPTPGTLLRMAIAACARPPPSPCEPQSSAWTYPTWK